MAPPPKRIDAVEVLNKTNHALKVKVVYDNHKDKTEIVEEQNVDPGQSHHFSAKELDMGEWQAVAPIVRLDAEGPGGSHSLVPAVSGIVKLLRVAATEAAGGLQLAAL